MITIKRDIPRLFNGKTILVSQEQNLAMETLAEAISINRGPLTQLLLNNNVKVNPIISNEELLKITTQNFKANPELIKGFAKAYAKKDYSNVDGETPGTKSSGTTDPYTGATVSIMNAFASIFGAFSKPDSTAQQLTFNQQVLALAAEKEAQRQRNQKIAMIVTVGLILGTITFLAIYAKKNKAI